MSLQVQSAQPVQAKFIHENGTHLRLQVFLTVKDASGRIALLEIEGYEGWCIPGESLLLNESPDDAARRVAKTWFNSPLEPRLSRVLNFPTVPPDDDRWYMLFVYEATAPTPLVPTPDTKATVFKALNEAPGEFAMSHEDVWNALKAGR